VKFQIHVLPFALFFHLIINPVTFYAMAALVALIIGFSKGGLGGTLGALATPLMALVMPADQVIGLILPVLMVYEAKNWHGVFAGTVAGFSSALAHTGGPPISIYLLMRRVPTHIFNATSALFFAILNWVKVPYYVYAQLFDLQQMRSLIWLLPLLPLGVWGGKWAADKISQEVFEQVIVALLAMTALLLIFS